MVETDGRRLDVIEALARLGPRPAGEAAEQAAAGYVAGELRALGLETTIEPFAFLGWAQERPATVELLAPEPESLVAGSMAYSASTPPDGVAGRVVRTGTAPITPGLFDWPEYALLDDAGAEVGFLLARAGGVAIPMPNTFPDTRLTRVVANIAEADAHRIDAWLEAGQEVRARLDTAGRLVEGLVSRNVVATLPGQTGHEIVVSCHLDTAPGAPGAIDNASGAQVMMDVARRLAAGPAPRKTFRFVAFGAEEYFLLGSIHHVARRATRGTLGAVVANLNVDTVGVGDTIFCLAGPEPVREMVRQAAAATGAAGFFNEIAFAESKPAVDSFPFHQHGIPNLSLVVWPYAEYHLPADDLPLVDAAVVEQISALSQELADRLDAADPAALRGA